MTLRASLWQTALACACLISFSTVASAQAPAQVHMHDDTLLAADTNVADVKNGTVPRRIPVLFVHGHNADSDNDVELNYHRNFQDDARTSFYQTLELRKNAWLDIEDYYIRFTDQAHSISQDALAIRDAVDLILHRHDTSYSYPHVDGETTQVRVVIIAYSKGTISSRLYLKNLLADQNYDFNPISEFIAIAPPNHGIEVLSSSCSGQQLMNGRRITGNPPCQVIPSLLQANCDTDPAGGENFISNLNTGNEAPGSRADTANGVPNPISAGTLYVTLYASGDRDFVGGDTDPVTCNSRPLARNLSPNAVNIPISSITGGTSTLVHQNTIHTADVICKALYAAVHHRSPMGLTCSETVDSKPVVPRAAVMLTLDFSGSMSARVCPGCDTRAQVLKDAVTLFVDLWKATADPADRPADQLAATYFRTSVSGFPADNSLVLLGNSQTVIDDITLQNPGDNTAMGGGLQRSLGILKEIRARSPLSRIILFTDGMQNVNPMVRSSSSGQLFINSTPAINLDQSQGIAIDTIGIGAADAFVSLLEDISTATAGHSRTTIDANLLNEFFTNELIDALRGSSPQLVAYRRGTLRTNTVDESFNLEDGIRRVVLMVNWKRGNPLEFSVLKDGVDVTQAGHFTNGPFYRIFTIDVPKGSLVAGGQWQLRLKGKPAAQYETAAIVEGGRISYDARFSRKQDGGRQTLDLLVKVTANGKAVGNKAKVSIRLSQPTLTIGDVVAGKLSRSGSGAEPEMSEAEQNVATFAQDPEAFNVLKPKTSILTPRPDDNGEFRVRLFPRIPGVYTAAVTIEGSDPKLGRFTRSQTVTAVVRFAGVELKKSNLLKTSCSPSNIRCVELVLSPRDSGGHFMGPGLATSIFLSPAAGIRPLGVRDFGDGRYGIQLELSGTGDPTIKLSVAGKPLYDGVLSKIRSR